MRKINTYLALCLLIALATTVFAEDANITVEPEVSVLQEAVTRDVAVTVNGESIKQSLVNKIAAPQIANFRSQGLPPQITDQIAQQVKSQIINSLIEETLMIQQVKKDKIEITEEQKNEFFTEIASKQQPPMSVEQFRAILVENGQDLDEVDKQITNYLGVQKLVEKVSEGKITDANQAEAKAFYDTNIINKFTTQEQARASHIFIGTGDIDPNSNVEKEKKARLKKAQKLLKKARKKGADFAELAKEVSAESGKENDGDLGYFQRGKLPKPIEDAAFAMEPNDISDVVESDYGYHIIKLVDKTQAQTTPFEQVKDDIILNLTQEKKNKLMAEYIATLKAEAEIVYPKGKEQKAVIIPPVNDVVEVVADANAK